MNNKKLLRKIFPSLNGLSGLVCFLFILLVSKSTYASTGLLFNVTTTGISDIMTITLCLNGEEQISCQNFTVSGLSLRITTTSLDHTYFSAGIKIQTPGHTLSGCAPASNGYCLFSVSNTSPKILKVTPLVGASAGGGVIACLGGAPYMNIIAASNDSITGIPWGSFGTSTGAQSTSDGARNSATLLSSGVTNSAVNQCAGTINGYNGWFLPAKEQLNCLYANQSKIPGFMNAVYWSSTESDENNAWYQFFDNGNVLSIFKTFYGSVRCVRSMN